MYQFFRCCCLFFYQLNNYDLMGLNKFLMCCFLSQQGLPCRHSALSALPQFSSHVPHCSELAPLCMLISESCLLTQLKVMLYIIHISVNCRRVSIKCKLEFHFNAPLTTNLNFAERIQSLKSFSLSMKQSV